jgi:hypothetical protein
MINKKAYLFILLSFLFFCSSGVYAIRMADVKDGAEEVLYGRAEVTSLIQGIIENIDQPETDFWLKQAPIRGEEEAKVILGNIIPRLQEKISTIESSQVKERLNVFIKMDLSEYSKIPLSYLVERIYFEL